MGGLPQACDGRSRDGGRRPGGAGAHAGYGRHAKMRPPASDASRCSAAPSPAGATSWCSAGTRGPRPLSTPYGCSSTGAAGPHLRGGWPATPTDAAEAAPGTFRSGFARLTERTGAPVVPVSQAGGRRITSASVAKQLAGLATAPQRRPDLRVHVGAPLQLIGDRQVCTTRARTVVTSAWRTAPVHLGEPAALAAYSPAPTSRRSVRRAPAALRRRARSAPAQRARSHPCISRGPVHGCARRDLSGWQGSRRGCRAPPPRPCTTRPRARLP